MGIIHRTLYRYTNSVLYTNIDLRLQNFLYFDLLFKKNLIFPPISESATLSAVLSYKLNTITKVCTLLFSFI